jgi:signal transduction histidine kinase
MSQLERNVLLPIARTPAERASWSTDAATRFASLVANELRTPLTLQRALLELALSDPATDASSWREIGQNVLDACKCQERLVGICLSLARCERPHRREPIDLATIVSGVLRAHSFGELGSVVRLESALTTGDPELLELLVANLISNAIRHNVVSGSVEIATRAESQRAVLMVENTGPPIPAHAIELLFQPFKRLNRGDGLGLGLTVVDVIANAHESSIDARARVGGGLQVHVGFPAHEPLQESRVSAPHGLNAC